MKHKKAIRAVFQLTSNKRKQEIELMTVKVISSKNNSVMEERYSELQEIATDF